MEWAVTSDANLEVRASEDGRPVITGYAAVYDSVSQDLGGFVEVVRRGAFDASLAENPEVSARVQHEGGLTTIGRTSNGTLKLKSDAKGLHYTIYPPDTTAGRDIVELVRSGYINKSSFAFSLRQPLTEAQRWNTEKSPPLRELLSVNIHDVAPVDGPAYEATSAEARAAALADLEGLRATVQDAAQEVETPRRVRIEDMSRSELAALIAADLREARGKAPVVEDQYREPFDPSCASHHLGLWLCKPSWLAAQVYALQRGTFKRAKTSSVNEEKGGGSYLVREDGLAVVEIFGPITKGRSKFGGTSSVYTRGAVRRASLDEAVKAIVLLVDSPGGTVAGTQDLADEVRNANARKPVFAYIQDMGCSAAYWIASQARRIAANESAQIGGIGCVAVVEDSSAQAAMSGIKVHVIASGAHKGAFTPGAPVEEEHLREMHERVNEINDLFVRDVARGRGLSEEAVRALADGRDWLARKVVERALIDEVRGFEEFALRVGLEVDLELPA